MISLTHEPNFDQLSTASYFNNNVLSESLGIFQKTILITHLDSTVGTFTYSFYDTLEGAYRNKLVNLMVDPDKTWLTDGIYDSLLEYFSKDVKISQEIEFDKVLQVV